MIDRSTGPLPANPGDGGERRDDGKKNPAKDDKKPMREAALSRGVASESGASAGTAQD